MIKEPEYPELEGIAKVFEVIGNNDLAVKIQFSDGGKFTVATRLLRLATKDEVRKSSML